MSVEGGGRSTDLLEDGNGKGGGLASTRLGLRNDVVSFHDGDNGTLLDGRGAFETGYFQSNSTLSLTSRFSHSPVSIDASEEFRLQLHIIEAGMNQTLVGLITKIRHSLVYDLVPVGLDLIFGNVMKFFSGKKGEKRRQGQASPSGGDLYIKKKRYIR
jgi:hypothetical protein